MRVDEGRTPNPGTFLHRVTYQQKSVIGQNSSGEDVWEWINIYTSVPAQVKSLTGREMEQLEQRWAEAKYQIKHHYIRGLDRVDRIAWYVDGEQLYLDILDIQDQAGTGRVQVIIAKEWEGVEPTVPSEIVIDDVPSVDDITNWDTLTT